MDLREIDLGTQVEFALSAKDALAAGFVQVGREALSFRRESDGTVRRLAIEDIDALKLEDEYFVLLRHAQESKEAKLRFGLADNARAFHELLGERIRVLENHIELQADQSNVGNGGKPTIKYKTMGFLGFSNAEVTSPVEVASAGESYVVYAVRSHARIHRQPDDAEWIVFHRYSDFEKFDFQIRALITENLDSNNITLPPLPPKPWIPAAQTSRDFVESRARKLGRYLAAVLAIPALTAQAHYLEALLAFVSQGEYWRHNENNGGLSISPNSKSLLESGIVQMNHGLSRLLDSQLPMTSEQEYAYIANLFKQQKLTMRKFAWDKLVIGVFGTTSAGKSSLVNHLMTLACAASSMAGQVDSGFSFFETCSESEFQRFSPELRFPEFSKSELQEPLRPADQNLCGDRRYGFVFVYLSAEETLERFGEQLAEDQGVLRRFSKLRSVLINQRYLSGTREEIALAKKLIIIDSKGMDASTFNNGDDSVWSEVQASQFIAKISHLNLFLMPANDIRNAEPSLSVFELAVVCSEEGIEFLKAQKKNKAKKRQSGESNSVTNQMSNMGGSDPFAGLIYRMLGVDGIVGAVSRVAGSIASYVVPPKSAQSIDSGTARWQKTFFILSRADEVLASDPGASGQLFYELGVAFGRRLNYLDSPTFARIALLGLPEKQGANPVTGFLEDFKRYLVRQSIDSSYNHSRDDAVISMCEQLEAQMKGGWVSSAYFQFQKPYIRKAKASALARRLNVEPRSPK